MSRISSDPLPKAPDKVLLTGGTSYLGRRLTRRLLAAGTEVHITVRPTSDLSRLDGLHGKPVFHVHDGGTKDLVNIIGSVQPAVVFHMATQYLRHHKTEQIDDLITNNILFGTQLLEAMQQASCKRLISLGTFFQFHNSDNYSPTNLYAATKQAFEDIVAFYREAHDFSTATLILYDTYGPGDWRGKLMNAIRDAQFTGSPLDLVPADTIMDLVYVEDVVDALLHTAQEKLEGGPWTVRSDNQVSLEEVIRTFEVVGGKPVQANYGVYPVPDRTPGKPWKGPLLPGWQPATSLQEGIKRFLAGEN